MHNLLAGKAWPKGWEALPQKNQAHDRQEILVAGIVGVGPQGVCRTPEPFFNGIHMFELGQMQGPFSITAHLLLCLEQIL